MLPVLSIIPIHMSDKEYIKRLKKRMKLNDAFAFVVMGFKYYCGSKGVPKNKEMALDLWKKGARLGCSAAHAALGGSYMAGEIVDFNFALAYQHFRLAAIGGDEGARHKLGAIEKCNNMDVAMKHFMIAAKAGCNESLKEIGEGYKAGYVTKDDYAITLRAHQASKNEMKSEQRTRAIAWRGDMNATPM